MTEAQGEPIDMAAIFARVAANRDKLDACPKHFFGMLPALQLGGKATCQHCKGELDLVALNQYVRGYEAAGRSGNDIVTGWREPPNPDQPPARKVFKAPRE